jgi:ABC-type polysaccharide/polyol phosphate export permease
VGVLVSAIRSAAVSLIPNSTLVTRVYVPREVFSVALVLSQLVDCLVASAVLCVFFLAAGTRPALT